MAWATKCDRCGKFFEYHPNDTNGVALLNYDVGKDKYTEDDDTYDLCPDCVKSWEDWFKRGKAQLEEATSDEEFSTSNGN